jgi:5'-deoxynucleotidase YfbR-like HD superfamily hydrolase
MVTEEAEVKANEVAVLDPRRAGRVRRYNTWPHIQEQTVAEHSWQLLRIIYTVYPEASPNLLHFCMFHDIAEVVAGDLPYPVKKNNPELKAEHQKVEQQTYEDIQYWWGIQPPKIEDPMEELIFKAVHYLEMMEWAIDESRMGNSEASLVFERCQPGYSKCIFELEKMDRARLVYYRFNAYVKHRREIGENP